MNAVDLVDSLRDRDVKERRGRERVGSKRFSVATGLFVACRILSPEPFLATEVVICLADAA
jgi:hypothetical protein